MSSDPSKLKTLTRPAPFNICALLLYYFVPGEAKRAGLPVRKNGKPVIKAVAKRLRASYTKVLSVLKLVKTEGIEALENLGW